jgi:ParB-like nuclease domain
VPPPLAVTYCPVGTLRPDPRNARTHPKQQVDQIVASIRQFGFVNPILADPDGRIIAGHGRLMAAISKRSEKKLQTNQALTSRPCFLAEQGL